MDRIRAALNAEWSEQPVVGREDMPDREIQPGQDRLREAYEALARKKEQQA